MFTHQLTLFSNFCLWEQIYQALTESTVTTCKIGHVIKHVCFVCLLTFELLKGNTILFCILITLGTAIKIQQKKEFQFA